MFPRILPGGEAAVYPASELSFLRHPRIPHEDGLGSNCLSTTWTHTIYLKTAYAPFCEAYNESGSTPGRSFTGQDQSTATDWVEAFAQSFFISGHQEWSFRRFTRESATARPRPKPRKAEAGEYCLESSCFVPVHLQSTHPPSAPFHFPHP